MIKKYLNLEIYKKIQMVHAFSIQYTCVSFFKCLCINRMLQFCVYQQKHTSGFNCDVML